MPNPAPIVPAPIVRHVRLKLGAHDLLLHDDFPEYGGQGAKAPSRLGGMSCTLHMDVSDADAAWVQAIEAGAAEVMPLANQFWGSRYGRLNDPFGHVWSIGRPLK